MVPADSRRVSPAPRYSGYHYNSSTLRLQDYHPLWSPFPERSTRMNEPISWSYNPPRCCHREVWAVPRSLTTTWGITLVFFSCSYLDVSVRSVRPQPTSRPGHGVVPFGYPRIYAFVQLPAAFRSFTRPSSPVGTKASTVCPFLLVA